MKWFDVILSHFMANDDLLDNDVSVLVQEIIDGLQKADQEGWLVDVDNAIQRTARLNKLDPELEGCWARLKALGATVNAASAIAVFVMGFVCVHYANVIPVLAKQLMDMGILADNFAVLDAWTCATSSLSSLSKVAGVLAIVGGIIGVIVDIFSLAGECQANDKLLEHADKAKKGLKDGLLTLSESQPAGGSSL